MTKTEATTVKDAVHKLQLCLLDGIQDENKLLAAGSLMCRSDYQDVVTERTIVNMCGYPLCSNFLPSDRPHKGRYRIALREHKIYDLRETYMYCSTNCCVNSRAFAGSCPEERSSTLNPSKLNEVLRLFEVPRLDSEVDLGRKGGLGSFELKIQEKVEVKSGEASPGEWIGPSNAIEGYVPQMEKTIKPPQSKNLKKGSTPKHSQLNKNKNVIFDETDFTSAIIFGDEYSISKLSGTSTAFLDENIKESTEKASNSYKDDQVTTLGNQVGSLQIHDNDESKQSDKKISRISESVKNHITEASTDPYYNNLNTDGIRAGKMLDDGKDAAPKTTALKSSLKPSGAKKAIRSVTWADKKTDPNSRNSLTEFRESGDPENVSGKIGSKDIEDDDDSYRFASAEACATALNQAAQAVASGSDISCAVSEAGIIILPPPQKMDEVDCQENGQVLGAEPHSQNWPTKPGPPNYNLFDSEDTWYDSPPEEFNLSLSPFSTMFMALFAWISSSSLAFIYGRDESAHEEYSFINGREYPRQIVLTDGLSAEIKQTLAGCLSRALPVLVADLRLPVPISTLEKGMASLIDTMSFVDPLPSFRMKQWQLIVLLFLDALSICRIPLLTPYMTGRRILLPKVLDGAQISAEEYEIMKDLIIPLGRVPEFTMQSGA
ncbi:PREDICTED: putative RNA polymerase II subunit B1 CTD phosphatase RPAP2 homolog isoform X3 [Ipomoea nil]|uniref:putative RNA polymerase II subunit B1 CTD phosphatase RPAP2 homolog isoform X3 n=1 Tax=Ipomoea nil TaxID=35883 RepID=UPI000900DE71|nr:PREDICTED: putative RNA polymerase II subunit B1 CTD phosphatase RPAP2 homolog isoform X3 [Ipomoea nil]